MRLNDQPEGERADLNAEISRAGLKFLRWGVVILTRNLCGACRLFVATHAHETSQGTLGRQGNPHVVERVTSLIKAAGKDFVLVLLSEITPQKLATFEVSTSLQKRLMMPDCQALPWARSSRTS